MMYYPTCAYCGKEFDAERNTAKYCSDTCRVKYNNIPKRIETLRNSVAKSEAIILQLLNKYPEFSKGE